MSAPLWCRFARPSCVPVRRGSHDPRRQGRVLIGAGRQVPADPQRGLGSGDSAGLQGLAAHSGPGLDVGVPVSRAMGVAVLENRLYPGWGADDRDGLGDDPTDPGFTPRLCARS